MKQQIESVVPLWYWAIATAALLWNLMGCAFFGIEIFAQEAAMESMTQAQKEWARSIPRWIYFVYGLAVSTGVAGSTGLFLRKGWTVATFAICLVAVILATASDSKSMSELIGGLAARGRMIVAGAGSSRVEVSPTHLLFGSRGIEGTLTGSAIDNEDTLAFSVLDRIKPMIETVPLEKAAEGYQRMLSNNARFRMVIVTDHNQSNLVQSG